ncbi:MAG: hypothetical protein ACK2U9_13695 [Anaerolineae bacterium]|jgi:hypothetical protein
MDRVGQAYLRLALRLEQHFQGFVDAYFGPAELKAEIEAEGLRPLAELMQDAQQLQADLQTADYDAQRQDFLTRQVRAMIAVIRNLSGDTLDFRREVELYFDITPEMVDEATFEQAQAEIDRLLPGRGSLVDRMNAWKVQMELAPDRILPVFERALEETRQRTLGLFELPAGENLSLQLVEDQPWSAYNWYLGQYRSRIEINTDLPLRANSAIPLLAHEAYPGHHTEHALKEQHLYELGGRAEHAVQLLLAPECVLSEGIANSAQYVIFDHGDLIAFLRDELYPLAGPPDADAERDVALMRATEGLRGVSGNAALHLHRDNRPPQEVQQYLEHYGLRTSEEASHSMRFLQNPLFRSYVFNYSVGSQLLAPLLEGQDAVPNFRRLLSEPFTPSQVRRWVEASTTD